MRTEVRHLAALAALLVVASCAHVEAAASPPVAVAVEPARAATAGISYSGVATIEPVHTYRVGFEVAGRVTSVNADVGDRVNAGATLATIDAASYRAQYAVAAAQAASADAQAARTVDGLRPEEVAQARDAVARAQAAADLATANERRYTQLYAEGDISTQARDQNVQAARDARAALDAARAQAALAQEGARAEDRSAAVAGASAARAQTQLAAVTLAKTAIAAPADAYVQSRNIEEGSLAEPGAVAFVLSDAGTPQAYADVPERIAARVRVGDVERVVIDGVARAARVTRVEPVADAVTRTRQVRLALPRIAVAPGDVARIEVRDVTRLAGVSVPLGALLGDGAAHSVATVDAGTQRARVRAVRVLRTDGSSATVDTLAPGALVIVAGQYDVRDGDRVRIVAKDGAQ